jgi:ABC-type uncharacterized transport system permease subunit
MVYVLFGLAVCGAVLECMAAAAALLPPLRSRPFGALTLPRLLAAGGALSFALLLAIRGMHYQLLPLTSGVESLSLMVIMIVATVLAITLDQRRRTLLLIYLPAVAAISIVAAMLAPAALREAPKPLSAALLLLHVVPAFLAYAWFFIAMLTSAVYLYQAARLKRRAALSLQHLPSLEQLDATLFHLIRMAYPLFVLTLILGAYWAWYDRALLGAYWWLSPKIILSLCMVVIYAVCYHGRAAGWLRGPRLANVLVIGIGGLLASYLVLEIFHLTNYNFWDGAA